MLKKSTMIWITTVCSLLFAMNSHSSGIGKYYNAPFFSSMEDDMFGVRVDAGFGAQYAGLGARVRLYSPKFEYLSVYGAVGLASAAVGIETNFSVFENVAVGASTGALWDREYRAVHINYYFDGVEGRGWSAGIEYAALLGYQSDVIGEPYVDKSDTVWITVAKSLSSLDWFY